MRNTPVVDRSMRQRKEERFMRRLHVRRGQFELGDQVLQRICFRFAGVAVLERVEQHLHVRGGADGRTLLDDFEER